MKEITSVHNAAVQLLRELQKPRARRENGLFVCESAKLVGEAVALRLSLSKRGARRNTRR